MKVPKKLELRENQRMDIVEALVYLNDEKIDIKEKINEIIDYLSKQDKGEEK